MSALDVQVGGEHYKTAKIQPVQYIEANQLAFLEGCVVKRVTRHNKPTGKGRQDIEKAIHELQLLLELRYGEEVEETSVEETSVEETSVESPKRMFVQASSNVGAPWMPHVTGAENPARHNQTVEVTFADGETGIGLAGGYVWTSRTKHRITHWRPHTAE